MKKYIFAALIVLISFNNAFAAATAKPGKIDPRIKTVVYNQRDVVVVHGHYGYSTHIQFADDENITHLSPGDSLAWQIVPKQNHLFLKPMEDNANTNLSVLTDKRQYNFELRAHNAQGSHDKSLSYAIRFHYPEDEMKQALAMSLQKTKDRVVEVVPGKKSSADKLNFDYSYRGSDDTAPTRVFDDGEFTYFQFPNEVDTPAIFLVDQYKKESIVNFHVAGRYVVVQRTGRQFMLRSGNLATCVFNDRFVSRAEPTELPEVTKKRPADKQS